MMVRFESRTGKADSDLAVDLVDGNNDGNKKYGAREGLACGSEKRASLV